MTQQLPNVANSILHHSRPLQTQSKSINPHVLWQAHGLQHLWPEHATVSNLDPLVKANVEAEDLHTGLGVGVESGLEAQVRETHVGEEVFQEAHQATEGETKVGDYTFDLVELGEMGCVDCFVTEDTVDGEVARRTWVFGETVERPC